MTPEQLIEITANIEAHIERRAQEIAAPRIAEVEANAKPDDLIELVERVLPTHIVVSLDDLAAVLRMSAIYRWDWPRAAEDIPVADRLRAKLIAIRNRQQPTRGATCNCGHAADDHDAGECWAEVDGDRCGCVWFEVNDQSRVEGSAPSVVKESLKPAGTGIPANEATVRAKVAEELHAAAQAIVDSRGENDDALADAIWSGCEQSPVHPATLDDPRTIATVAYRHIGSRLAHGERP